MSTASATTTTLSPSEIAQIPSASIPIGPQISHLLNEFTTLSLQLFTLFSASSTSLPQPLATLTAPIYASLAALDRKLARLVSLLEQHQARQRRINALIESLQTLDSTWYRSAETLHDCVERLEPILASGRADRRKIDVARAPALTSTAILSYARLLAPFTSAPPSSLYPPNEKLRGVGATDPTGRSLPVGAIPPFPTEGVMRRGRLQFGRETQALGQTNEVGMRKPSPSHPNATASPKTLLELEARHHPQNGGQAQDGSSTTATDPYGLGTTGLGVPSYGVATANGGGGEEADDDDEDFEFDLDLNPDL
ncbi:hypothetical protein JCM10212_006000 [Sporobolomyces blumeae]